MLARGQTIQSHRAGVLARCDYHHRLDLGVLQEFAMGRVGPRYAVAFRDLAAQFGTKIGQGHDAAVLGFH